MKLGMIVGLISTDIVPHCPISPLFYGIGSLWGYIDKVSNLVLGIDREAMHSLRKTIQSNAFSAAVAANHKESLFKISLDVSSLRQNEENSVKWSIFYALYPVHHRPPLNSMRTVKSDNTNNERDEDDEQDLVWQNAVKETVTLYFYY